MAWLSIAGRVAVWLIGLLWNKPAVSTEERLGKEETNNENASRGLDEVRRAVDARDRADAASSGKLLDGSSPAAAPYRPGPD